ncbi:MAG: cache domain-containing protein [bacterium]
MVKWDDRFMLIKSDAGKFKRSYFEEPGEPNLLREDFPYTEVPRIAFDGVILPVQPAEDAFITDTTFRDGQQARPPYSARQIVDIYTLMHRLGGPGGLIRQTEFFLYSDKDKEAVEKCKELGFRYPEITGWIRANKDDLKLVKEMEIKETGILTSASDYHIYLKMGKTRSQALEDYLAIVKEALSLGISPRCHFEDATRADVYGFCVPFAQELMKLMEESGIKIKIRICDTMGYGVPYPGAALPRAVDKWVRAMTDEAGVPGECLEWHGHNDFHKVLVNAVTAWNHGCSAANGTLLGFGERTGNPPVEGLVIEYLSLRGNRLGADTTVITEIAEYFDKELGVYIPSNYPFVGEEFNTTSAGIHADGAIKNEEIYNIFDTAKILNRPMRVIINDKSGVAGITYWLNDYLGLRGEDRISKRHPGVIALHQKIKEQYEQGRVTSMSQKEMRQLAARYLPQYFVSHFDRLKKHAEHLAMEQVEQIIETDDLRSMEAERIEPALAGLLKDSPYIQYAYVVDLDGKLRTRPVTHPGDKHAFSDEVIGSDYSNRQWFKTALEDGKVHVTDFYTSRITNRLCVTVSGPILDREGAEIAGVLGVDMMFEELLRYDEQLQDEKDNE